MSKKTYEARHVRGVILGTLQSYYPNGLSGRNIFDYVVRPVFPAMEWDETCRHLAYLRERGFVEHVMASEIQDIDSSRDVVYRLTASGLDIASGVVEDPAILVEV